MMTRRRDIGVFFAGFASGALVVVLFLRIWGEVPQSRAQVTTATDHKNEPTAATFDIGLPISGLRRENILDTFDQKRDGGKSHEAADIMAPRGTPIFAVASGTIRKLFLSKPGGHTIYQFDAGEIYCYYYAHLDRYATGLTEGKSVQRGELIGYVGSSGNADPRAPHLHFAIFQLGPDKHWWKGTAINPFPQLKQALQKQSPNK
jgi:murein DD-endopeptidase MepM/ murein hydrolase activator NlpD